MNATGRKILIFLSLLVFAILAVGTSYAVTKSSVHVETEGDGEANVHVENKVTSNTTTTTTKSTGRTDIVIECNGVKKEYHSDKAENVTLNCDDSTTGTVKSEVKITNGTSPTSKVSPNPTQIEELKKQTDEIKDEVNAAKDKIKEERKNLFEQMTQFFREFFKNFHF